MSHICNCIIEFRAVETLSQERSGGGASVILLYSITLWPCVIEDTNECSYYSLVITRNCWQCKYTWWRLTVIIGRVFDAAAVIIINANEARLLCVCVGGWLCYGSWIPSFLQRWGWAPRYRERWNERWSILARLLVHSTDLQWVCRDNEHVALRARCAKPVA